MTARATLHLLIGPVGAGKTTFAQHHASRSAAVLLDLDSWMVRLFGGDTRPSEDVMSWYLERRGRCRGLMWDTALSVLGAGTDVYLEIGLLGKIEREAFYEQVRMEEVELVVHVVDAPREVRRERVLRRNESPGPFTQVVPPALFERASDAWEPPDESERARWGLVDA
jgi:predicted kinase